MRKHNLVEVREPPTPATKKRLLSFAPARDNTAQSSGALSWLREFSQLDTNRQPTTQDSLLNFSSEHKIIFRNILSGKRRKVWGETFQSSQLHRMEAGLPLPAYCVRQKNLREFAQLIDTTVKSLAISITPRTRTKATLAQIGHFLFPILGQSLEQ